jgi:ABC-type uncharacterized transport system substrate-binding protein
MTSRRQFISLLGGAATTWPLTAGAQQPAMPVIGFLSGGAPDRSAHVVAAFHRGLAENGYAENRNVTLEYRWAIGQYDRLPALATELVQRPVAVLVATGGEAAPRAAIAATTTIPIVASFGSDPVESGLVTSLNRPGGNVTGISPLHPLLEPKRLGVLHELMPKAATIGVLLNPNHPPAASQLRDLQNAARTLGLQLHVLHAATDREIDTAFETVAQNRIPALAVAADPFLLDRRDKVVALAARRTVPAMYPFRDFAVTGGLMSYGTDLSEVYRQLGIYSGRILKGTKPAELPVMQPTKFAFVINLKAAKALGLTVPPALLAIADEVIE